MRLKFSKIPRILLRMRLYVFGYESYEVHSWLAPMMFTDALTPESYVCPRRCTAEARKKRTPPLWTSSEGAPDWRPRRNGNRFDHKQTAAYLGHWAALGRAGDRMSCIRFCTTQRAGLSSVCVCVYVCKPLAGCDVGAGGEFRVSTLIPRE